MRRFTSKLFNTGFFILPVQNFNALSSTLFDLYSGDFTPALPNTGNESHNPIDSVFLDIIIKYHRNKVIEPDNLPGGIYL